MFLVPQDRKLYWDKYHKNQKYSINVGHHYHKRTYLGFLVKRLRRRADVANVTSSLERFLDDYVYRNTLSLTALNEILPAFDPVRHILGLPDYS
jgi:hypothetical protein